MPEPTPEAAPGAVPEAAPEAIIDRQLVRRFCDGERAAFTELVRRYQKPIYYLALRYVKHEADAADVTQKTFIRVFKALAEFRGESSFRTWIYRIAINIALNHLRDHRREQATEIRDDALTAAPLGAAGVIRREESAKVRTAMEALPPKQRTVLELRIYDELSFREIAELTDSSENAAKVNFHHAVKRLRAVLAEPAEPLPASKKESIP